MAHGVPVVATDSGGVRELIGDGRGILVPKGDAAALAAAFRRLALDSEAADRLGAAGRTRIQAEYDVRQTAADLMAAITSPLSARADSP
jgi:glycosyltransferase involved in cell wall biosynthesis